MVNIFINSQKIKQSKSPIKNGDLVRKKYPVYLKAMGVVIKQSENYVLVRWTDSAEKNRNQWCLKNHLWKIS